MESADRFRNFAVECQVIAKSTRNPEQRAVWVGLSKRWLRCAALVERPSLFAESLSYVHFTSSESGAIPG
jgi:hypothetical protein